MKTCIKNATLISMNENREEIEYNMDILMEDTHISRIGENIKTDDNTEIIDATDKVVLPGLINTHAHVPMSIFRETLDGYDLQDWLNKKIWPMEDQLTEEDIYYASYLSFIEMIKTGCTTINDMYFMADDSIKAMQETGIRLQTTRTLMNLGNEQQGIDRLNELKELVKKYKNIDSKLTFNVGIHGLYTSSEEYVERCIDFAKKEGLPIHMHFCENSKEVSDIEKSYNSKPTEILKKHFNGIHTLLAHGVKLSEQNIKDISKMNISVAHCPVSNLKLGCGIAKIHEMAKNGINVSLGTDGQGSGSNLDLFETMKYAALLQKGTTENPKVMPAYEVLKMATINGAKALQLQEKIGSIKEGKEADIIILDMDDVLTKPENNLISEIVYNAKGTNVNTTIVAGKILMQDRKLAKGIKEKEIYEKCNSIINRIKK